MNKELVVKKTIKKFFFGTEAISDWKVGSTLIFQGSLMPLITILWLPTGWNMTEPKPPFTLLRKDLPMMRQNHMVMVDGPWFWRI